MSAGVAFSSILPQTVSAQDYTTGAVSGTVVDAQQQPIADAQITLRSQAQNQARVFTSTAKGGFSTAGLVSGTYDITVHANGYEDYAESITVIAAQENRVTLTLGKVGADTIIVTGARVRQDFTKTTTGLNINVADIAKNAPVGRSVAALIELAPGTITGATGFGTKNDRVVSIGGSSVSENAYYINGLNITNPDTYVGSARVPFDFYQNVDIQTGGYAAEFGRATGGVINATTKSGSNTPMMAIHGNFEPDVQAHSRNEGDPENPDTIASMRKDYDSSLTIEASGPIIPDHLFLYGLFQPQSIITEQARPADGYFQRAKSNTPFYGGKADLYINPTQHFEFTIFNTKQTEDRERYEIIPSDDFSTGEVGGSLGNLVRKTGGLNWVGRYTGSITDWFQISGAYGISKDRDIIAPTNGTAYYVDNATSSTRVISQQTVSQTDAENTKRKFYRVDGDLRFSAFGEHHVRFGMDNEDLSMTHTLKMNGVLPIAYSYRAQGVRLTYEVLGGHVEARDRAFYVQDSWTPLTGLTINVGARDDEFNQKNLSGEKYLDFKNNWAARIGFNYVPDGVSPFRFFGNYGRYFIPPAMNLGFRGKDNYFREYFAYPAGYNADTLADPTTGLPVVPLGAALTNVSGYSSPCPDDISAAPGHPINGNNTCVVFGSNLQEPAYAKVARGTHATHEDEFILGMRYQPTPLLSFGLQGTYRKLSKVSEDTDFAPQLLDFYGCGTEGQTGTTEQCDRYTIGNTYYIWNPAKTVTVVDWVDPTKTVTLTNLDYGKPKRTYKAVVLDFKRVDDGVWNLGGSVTWSKSKGNYEGTVSSDIGNGVQTDAGSTVNFDYPGLTQNTYGLLPNDHRWAFKMAGGYHVTKEFYLGTNVQVISPMHGSCQGFNPVDPFAFGYGSISYFCGSGPLDADGNWTTSTPSPRGTGWKTDWSKQIDIALRYTFPESLGLAKGLTLRADIFNVFNGKAVLNRNPEHEIDSDGEVFVPNTAYKTPTAYQRPRYFRFGFDWEF